VGGQAAVRRGWRQSLDQIGKGVQEKRERGQNDRQGIDCGHKPANNPHPQLSHLQMLWPGVHITRSRSGAVLLQDLAVLLDVMALAVKV
jgi:hypothetical protein